MGVCRWCKGTGVQYVERGSSLCYTCPDCGGNGYLPECDICGEEYYGEYCEDCYVMCEECGLLCRRYADDSELCEDCYNEMEVETKNA
jgi:hypothetical protein